MPAKTMERKTYGTTSDVCTVVFVVGNGNEHTG